MARLYYTCPIKALYMIKEFGVELEFPDEDGDLFNFKHCGINGESVSEFLEGVDGYPEKIYVAKDSEHIFEPKDYDLRNDVDWNSKNYTKNLNSNCKIIMRDDKHFFMPEVENDN